MWKYFPDISSYITENFTSINTVTFQYNLHKANQLKSINIVSKKEHKWIKVQI